MWWFACWAVVAGAGVLGMVASANSVRFGRRVAREVRELTAASERAPTLDDRVRAGLPAPVQRYLAKAIGARSRPIHTVRLRHGGTFRTSLDGSWLPIRGLQYFTADPPGFIWWGRVRLAPGVWIDARDRSVGGAGHMFVAAESTWPLVDSSGPRLDQGALARLLGELAWLPTALEDGRYVQWTGIDDRRARATLHVNGRAVTGTFEFGADDLPAAFTAERYRDIGGGRAVLTPFVGRLADYRSVDGVLAPHHVVAAWIVDGTPIEYAAFDVEQLEFDRAAPA